MNNAGFRRDRALTAPVTFFFLVRRRLSWFFVRSTPPGREADRNARFFLD